MTLPLARTTAPVEFAGLRLRLVGEGQLRAAIDDRAGRDLGGLLVGYVNPHVVTLAPREPVVASFLGACDMVLADGIGVSAVVRLLRRVPVERVVAQQFLDELLNDASVRGTAVVIGIEADALGHATGAIDDSPSGIHVVDSIHGFASDADTYEMLCRNPDVDFVFIGAGSPRSESLALGARERCPHAVVFACGAGSLKVLAGTKQRAPSTLSRFGGEWLHRIVHEPHTRRRYTVGLVQYARVVASGSRLQQSEGQS